LKIVQVETIFSRGQYAISPEWEKTWAIIQKAVCEVDWPPGSGKFTIYPESGKKRGEGNGVKPIKNGLISELERQGWKSEQPLDIATVHQPGDLDAVLFTDYGPVALEWETGNISSSHRALNKMALGLLKGKLAAAILIVPSREFYKYLTDRVGNFSELQPYLDLWRSIPYKEGIFNIVVIEHDDTSTKVLRIPKGTDGRSVD
jgi:hypothetical protein